jgi:thiamine biosynthesis lipoprotein
VTISLSRFQFHAMGSPCEIQFYCDDPLKAHQVRELVIQDVKRIEQSYSRYQEDSILSSINRVAAQGGSIAIDSETAALLNYADTCYQQSDGLFDITSGVLRLAWDFKKNIVPSPTRLKQILKRIGWDKVRLGNASVSFCEEGMQLDFGGIGKEYAVDRAANICRQHGILFGFIDLGGDIKIIGPHADGRPWSVGIRHPRLPGSLLTSLNVYSGAVATSGDYERCIIVNGRRYSHILNPKTGWPVRGFSSVTVLADQCVVAGSACTISMLLEKKGAKWITELGLPHIWMNHQQKMGGTLV